MKTRVVIDRLRDFQVKREIRQEVQQIEGELSRLGADSSLISSPIVFFNASTRIHRLSLNGAFSLLASWVLRANQQPVDYLVCHQGMLQCILGTQRDRLDQKPPCKKCMGLSSALYPDGLTTQLHLATDHLDEIQSHLEELTLDRMITWEYDGVPLGEICLPGLRWVLRRHHLPDTDEVRRLLRSYLASSVSLVFGMRKYFEERKPRAVVLFNGIFYPEAVARWVARSMNIPTITHEVGLRPMSAYFTHHEATFRQLSLPPDYGLSSEEESELSAYLDSRFQGKFTMAGIKFWPVMEALPDNLDEAIGSFEQVVTIFSNVIFDTSQIHANTLFDHMYAWLDGLVDVFDAYPETLFILRAHPDEDRPGKASEEDVASWVGEKELVGVSNFYFIPPSEHVSSYELIRQSKLVMIYNSSIGLEAAIMGAPVLAAARSRFTHEPTVFFPDTMEAYNQTLKSFLEGESIEPPVEFSETARKLMYYELFKGSLDLSEFLEEDTSMGGMVKFKQFSVSDLLGNPALNVIKEGILHGTSFVLDG